MHKRGCIKSRFAGTDLEGTVLYFEEFIRTAVRGAGLERVVVAVSGGVDSGVVVSLAAGALGPDRVYPAILPYGGRGKPGEKDAMSLVQKLAIPDGNVIRVDIRPLLAPVFRLIPPKDRLRRGNAMARMRMIVVYDAAKRLEALVVGTENKTEYLLGYYTLFGDGASDVEPIRGLYKTEVCVLAKHLGVPQKIIDRQPSAGLWPGQTDEDEFGFTYKDADEILYLTCDRKLSYEEVLSQGFSRKTVDAVIRFASKNDFKHHLPVVPGK